jgi:hypothetical protein
MICTTLRLKPDSNSLKNNDVAYLQSWLKTINENNNSLIFNAANTASKFLAEICNEEVLKEIEFEENQTPEAKFAHAMDNFQPLLLNDSNNGKDWVRHGIKKSQVVARQEKSKRGSNEIWEYSKALIERNAKKGNLKDE